MDYKYLYKKYKTKYLNAKSTMNQIGGAKKDISYDKMYYYIVILERLSKNARIFTRLFQENLEKFMIPYGIINVRKYMKCIHFIYFSERSYIDANLSNEVANYIIKLIESGDNIFSHELEDVLMRNIIRSFAKHDYDKKQMMEIYKYIQKINNLHYDRWYA